MDMIATVLRTRAISQTVLGAILSKRVASSSFAPVMPFFAARSFLSKVNWRRGYGSWSASRPVTFAIVGVFDWSRV
jgi:hypothetical protein